MSRWGMHFHFRLRFYLGPVLFKTWGGGYGENTWGGEGVRKLQIDIMQWMGHPESIWDPPPHDCRWNSPYLGINFFILIWIEEIVALHLDTEIHLRTLRKDKAAFFALIYYTGWLRFLMVGNIECIHYNK